jgi:hypothetical protein
MLISKIEENINLKKDPKNNLSQPGLIYQTSKPVHEIGMTK